MIEIIAHRGLRSTYPENTGIAIQKAIEAKEVTGVEFDVDLSSDNKAVIVHQETMEPSKSSSKLIKATRNSTSRDWVSNKTEKELTSIDAGSWFNENYKSEKIPPLSKVLNLNWKNTIAYMEIKDPSFWQVKDPKKPDKIVKILKEELRDFKGTIKTLSFNPEILKAIQLEFPNIKRLLNYWPEGCGSINESIQNAVNVNAEAICVPDPLLVDNPGILNDAHSRGLKLFTYAISPSYDEPEFKNWTAKSRKNTWDKLLTLGINGIITDFAEEFADYVEKRI